MSAGRATAVPTMGCVLRVRFTAPRVGSAVPKAIGAELLPPVRALPSPRDVAALPDVEAPDRVAGAGVGLDAREAADPTTVDPADGVREPLSPPPPDEPDDPLELLVVEPPDDPEELEPELDEPPPFRGTACAYAHMGMATASPAVRAAMRVHLGMVCSRSPWQRLLPQADSATLLPSNVSRKCHISMKGDVPVFHRWGQASGALSPDARPTLLGWAPVLQSTTILGLRHQGKVVMASDGQVTLGQTVVKHQARKVRRLYHDRVLAGFAGTAADGFALFSRFESKLEEHRGNLDRAAVELARDWRTDRVLRRLEAMLLVADARFMYSCSGTGDLIEPDDGIMGIGSGGPFAMAAARALVGHSPLDAREIVEHAMAIAADICIYTNRLHHPGRDLNDIPSTCPRA